MDRSSIQLGPVGIWTIQFEKFPAAKMQEAAAELEELGYGAIWFGEATGREALTQAGLLLAATKKIVVATGIANIYARDPFAMAAGQKTLAETYPGRFLLGLGVSHIPLVEKLRGHRYEKPVSTMRAYLDAMDHAPYQAVPPSAKPWRRTSL
jgi:probable F420-dependent oxidoreductase